MTSQDTDPTPDGLDDLDFDFELDWMAQLTALAGMPSPTAPPTEGEGGTAEFDLDDLDLDFGLDELDALSLPAPPPPPEDMSGDDISDGDPPPDGEDLMAALQADIAELEAFEWDAMWDDDPVEETDPIVQPEPEPEPEVDPVADTVAKVIAASEEVARSTARASDETAFAVDVAVAEQAARMKLMGSAPDVVTEALEDAIRHLDNCDRTFGPELPRGDTAKLLTEGRALLKRLEGDAVDPDDVAAARSHLVPAMQGLATVMVNAHYRQMTDTARALLRDCRSRAAAAGVELDPACIRDVEDDLKRAEGYRAEEAVIPASMMRQSLFRLEEPVRFAEGIKATKAGKLPLDDADIAEHAEICGDLDRVREIAKGLKPGRLEHLGPGPMAVVNCNFNSDDYPVPVVEPDGDGFRLAPVKVSDTSSHSCQITPIGEFSLGEIVATLDGQTQTMPESGGDSGNTFKKLKGSPDWVGKSLVRAVSAETYKELERRELEHLIDFDYAFQIGPAALGDAINTAAGTTHETPEAALDALIELLKARGQLTFVPKTPEKPEAWRSRMAVVMASVSDGSKKRDRMGTHSPSDNIPVVRGKAVILTPVFKEESLKTKTIITLGEATPVYGGADAEDGDGEGEGAEFTVGETRTVKTAMSSVAFLHKVDGEDVYLDELKTGDNVRIESKADGRGMIWIRYDHPDVIEYELAKSATVYALVPAANLE